MEARQDVVFLERKNQRISVDFRSTGATTAFHNRKSFCVFSSEKEDSSLSHDRGCPQTVQSDFLCGTK
jgi:hypothetical protein